MFTLSLLATIAHYARGGTILQGKNIAPIWNSIANANVQALYRFSFITETYLPAGGSLQVVFPNQYDADLGGAAMTCSVPCTLTGRTVAFQFPEDLTNGTTLSVSITPISNPPTRGGTGNFILRTMRGNNVLDENLIFGLIGIADSIQQLAYGSVVLSPTGSYYAGDYTSYSLLFKTTNTIPEGSYMILTLDPVFILAPFPACQSPPLNAQIIGGNIFCQANASSITIFGIEGQIKAQIQYQLDFSLQNPIYAQTTGTFSLGIYRSGTQMMYEQLMGIPGVTIQPAQLISVSMTPLDTTVVNSRSRIMDYVIKFTNTFPIPAGCNIKISFPAYMQILTNSFFNQPNGFQLHFVNYGLEDVSTQETVGFFYLNTIQNYLRITNFRAMTMINEISVTIRAKNPDQAGYTTPLKITVWRELQEYNLMAQDLLNAKTVIADYPSGDQTTPFPNPTTVTSTNQFANGQVIAILSFTVKPTRSVPKEGYIRVTIPEEFPISTSLSNTDCEIINFQSGAWTPSQTCTLLQRVITIWFPPAVSFDILLQPIHYFRLKNVITTPTRNGTYYFDVTTYDTDGLQILDTYAQFLVINANTLAIFTVKSIPRVFGVSAILDLQFVNFITIPSGQEQHKATDTQGFFELHFSGSWSNDLGTKLSDGDDIPCYGVNALVPVEGDQIKCTLRIGTATTMPIVVVKNFKEITANSNVRLLISGLVNPMASYNILLKIFQNSNRVFRLLNQANAAGILTAPSVAPAMCSNVPKYSEQRVGFLFDMMIQPCLQANVVKDMYIIVQLPKYDTGFVRLSNTITCKVNSQDVYCIPQYGSDVILLVSPPQTLLVSGNPTIKIKNLQWPRYVQQFNANNYRLIVQIIDPVTLNQLQHIVHNSLANPLPAQFDQILTVVPKKGNGVVDASYQFTFYPQALIPQGSIIVLQFPSIYNLLSGDKPPSFTQTGLLSAQVNDNVDIIINLAQIKVVNFKDSPAFTPFTLTANGIKNSATASLSTGWTISATYRDNLIVQKQNFFEFAFSTPFKPGYLVFNQITATNLNAGERAEYTLQFTPQTDIPQGGQIEITFPLRNYKSLPSQPSCRLTGGLSTFEICSLSSNTFIIVTNSRYTVGNGVITFFLRDVTNPDEGQTEGFLIQTSFAQVYLDLTDTSTTNGRTFTSYAKTLPISVQQISFNPQNEAEEAQYTFEFVTSNPLIITQEILFRFPVQYDSLLGRDIQCQVLGGLVGNSYECAVRSDRAVHLWNFVSYVPDKTQPIRVVIFGIVNPNANSAATDSLKIIVKPLTSIIYDESNSAAAQLSFFPAPGWSPLNSIQVTTQAVRLTALYNFTFTTNSKVPKQNSEGALIFDFPKQYTIADGTAPCVTLSDFAPLPTCTFYRNRVTIVGNYKDYLGSLYVQIQNVSNPDNEGLTDYFYIRTYDGLNTMIIERNFANLDPFQFDFYYPGPLIKVNNDEHVYVERGTQIIGVPVTVEFPSVLNLQLSPTIQPPFIISPSNIQLPLGVTKTFINISVPQSLMDGVYPVYWTITGELSPPLYTPVARTYLHVTATQKTKLIQTPILEVPLLGWSLLTEYKLEAPPDIGISLAINLASGYKGIKLDRSLIDFPAGVSTSGFAVLYDAKVNVNKTQVERGQILLVPAGTNQYIFKVASLTIDFTIIAQDTQDPYWISLNYTNVQRTSVDLVGISNEPLMVYYLLALRGTVLPSLKQMQAQSVKYPSTQSQYGYIVFRSGNLEYKQTITNLTAETDYVIHIYGIDRGYNQAPKKSLIFKTLDRPNACDFTLKFKREVLDADFKYKVAQTFAFIFGISEEMIQERKYYFQQDELDGRRRMLQNTYEDLVDQVSSYLDLQLIADPYSASFPAPVDVIASIVNKTQLFEAPLPDLDLSQEIVAVEFKRYQPQFVVRPTIVFLDYQFCAIKVQLDNYGWIFATAVKFESHTQTLPSSYQIYKGLDYQNRLVPKGMIEVTQPYQDFIVVINGLQPETDYFIYCVGGSVHPGYPDLMDSDQIYVDRIISFSAPPKWRLNINSGSIISITFMIFALMI